MEDVLLETVETDLEESTEMLFKITVEGLDQAPSKVRMVCENGSIGHVFKGEKTDQEGVLSFNIPANALKEATYLTKVEVLVENRYFAPVTFNLNAKKKAKVVVEAVRPRAKVPDAKVSIERVATTTVVQRPEEKASALREHMQKKKSSQDIAKLSDTDIQRIADRLLSGK